MGTCRGILRSKRRFACVYSRNYLPKLICSNFKYKLPSDQTSGGSCILAVKTSCGENGLAIRDGVSTSNDLIN